MPTRLRELIHRRWYELSIGAPPLARRLVLDPAKRALLPVLRPTRRLRRLSGHNPAGPLTLSFFGRFGRSLLLPRKLFFSHHQLEETQRRVPFWRLSAAARRADADLVMIDGGPRLIAQLPPSRALVMPARVDFVVDVRDGWDEVQRRFRKSAKENVRRARRNGYSLRLGSGDGDFETFYHRMYLPTVQARHGELQLAIPELESRVYFEHGLLLFLTLDGRDVAAALCHPQGSTLTAISYGVLDGEMGSRQEDRVGALQVSRLRWATESGFETVNLRSVEPCLRSGLFSYKRQWGARVTPGAGAESHLWLRVRRLTAAVRQCLEDNPLVVIDTAGRLDGLIFVRDPERLGPDQRRAFGKRFVTPGLRRLLLCSTDSLEANVPPVEEAVPI